MKQWLVTGAIAMASYGAHGMAEAAPLASVRLYNPTSWEGPALVEVPTGHLAAPGLVNWRRVHLRCQGATIPFAVREGRPHWRARLEAPVRRPRAEDLLVFPCAVPPGRWVRVDVLPGAVPGRKALRRAAGRLRVRYPGLEVDVEAASGLLQGVRAFGGSALQGPLSITCARTGGPSEVPVPLRAEMVASSSNAAMTELHFVLTAPEGLAVALSYRIHAFGLVEIWCDERPGQGPSPWLDHVLRVALPLSGDEERLLLLENRAPFYGFKDYAAAVRHPASLHRSAHALALELGEETANGRRWSRRIYLVSAREAVRASDLIEVADEGLVVEPLPMRGRLDARSACVSYPERCRVAAETVAEALGGLGVGAEAAPDGAGVRATVRLALLTGPAAEGIEGDGFRVTRTGRPKGICIGARTRFGLMQGALKTAALLDGGPGIARFPLIASNPAAHLRAGGFGGGEFEVDFPYGTDAEWDAALQALVGSGMNVMADLSMWSNWKMPVSYRYMPELQSDSPDAFDELSGSRFADIPQHREHGLKLLRFLQDRGVRVWQWIPVGCVPTTYARRYPEAMSPQSNRIPCFTHPNYLRYLQACLLELLETYPIDGIVMIRDDNGGLCACARCAEYVSRSRTKSPAWEQYLLLYDWLRAHGFRGDIAVYPYNDGYEPRLDALLPADLYVVGHGSGAGMLSCSYDTLAPMGDTWLDNLFASFRVPSSPRMKRLLADRNAFWIGGAYCGTELPWEAVGTFGWEPTATVNTFRYRWGRRRFGPTGALDYVRLSDVLEHLWDLYDHPMLPHTWVRLSPAEQERVLEDGRELLAAFRRCLASLAPHANGEAHAAWLAHIRLFGTYFECLRHRLGAFSEMRSIVAAQRAAVAAGGRLPQQARQRLLALHREVYDRAEAYDRQAAETPGRMLASTRAYQMTRPFRQWVDGFDPSLDGLLETPQFAGTIEVAPTEVAAGRAFVVRVRLRNTGICPWIAGVGHRLEVSGEGSHLGLPASWEFQGAGVVFGDACEVELRGRAPGEPGEARVSFSFSSPYRTPHSLAREDVVLRWR